MSDNNHPAPIEDPNQAFVIPSVAELNSVLGEEFTVEAIIGLGGMAVVYKGVDRFDNDRPIAIKLLPREIASRAVTQDNGFDYIRRFEREANAMARLNHNNIVKVYKLGKTSNDLRFFTMEYVDGDNLYNIKQSASVTTDHVYSWLLQICDALAYAHAEGIVHRDIKPGNILIDKEGVVKIADFGLVKLECNDSLQTLIAMGTPDFSAPEIAELHEKGDQRADIFSVGILAYQLFTGRLPKGLWEPPSQVVKGIDRRIDRLIDSALYFNKEKRYQDIGQMAEALRQIAPENITGVPPITIEPKVVNLSLLHKSYFPELTYEEFEILSKKATTNHAAEGEILVEKDLRSEQLILLIKGKLSVVDAANQPIAQIEPGSFVGEMGYLTGNRPNATVLTAAPCQYLSWDYTELSELCKLHPALKASINTKISTDLVEKLIN